MIRFRTSNAWDGDPRLGVPWTHYALWQSGAWHFDMVLLHELGHVLGLGHPTSASDPYNSQYGTCNAPLATTCPTAGAFGPASGTCAVMASDQGESAPPPPPPAVAGPMRGLNNQLYGIDDMQGLSALYGFETNPSMRMFENADIASTASFYEWAIASLPLVTDLDAAAVESTSPPAFVSVGGRDRLSPTTRFRVYDWNYSSGATSLVASLLTSGFVSNGPIGMSNSSLTRTLSHHAVRMTVDGRRYRRRLHDSRLSIATPTTVTAVSTDPAPGDVDNVSVGGVSTAYDTYNQSTIHAFRDAGGQVLLQAWRTTTGWSAVVQTWIYSYSQPAIACAVDVCVLVVTEMPFPITTSRETRLQWAEFFLDYVPLSGSAVTFSLVGTGVQTTGFLTTADPNVSVRARVGGGWDAFVTVGYPAALSGGHGIRTLTYRHPIGSTGPTAFTLLWPPVVDFTGVSPHITSSGAGTSVEIFIGSSL